MTDLIIVDDTSSKINLVSVNVGDRGLPGAKGDKGDKGDQGSQGIQGVKGDRGDDGTNGVDGINGDHTYTHFQSESQAIWNIAHGLHRYPSITIVDSANSVVEGTVEYLDMDTVRVSFGAGFSGKAFLN